MSEDPRPHRSRNAIHVDTKDLLNRVLRENPSLSFDASGGSVQLYNSMFYAALNTLIEVRRETFEWEAPDEPMFSYSFPKLSPWEVVAIMAELNSFAARIMAAGLNSVGRAARPDLIDEAVLSAADFGPAMEELQERTRTYPETFRWGWEASRILMAGRIIQEVLERLGLISR